MKNNPSQTDVFIIIKRMMCDKKICSRKDAKNVKKSHTIAEYFDSLDYVELIMDIEKHYSIAIPDEECNKHFTIKDIIKSVKKHIK